MGSSESNAIPETPKDKVVIFFTRKNNALHELLLHSNKIKEKVILHKLFHSHIY